jgi:hypothetical protein
MRLRLVMASGVAPRRDLLPLVRGLKSTATIKARSASKSTHRLDPRGRDVLMAKQIPNGPNVRSRFQKMRCERMTRVWHALIPGVVSEKRVSQRPLPIGLLRPQRKMSVTRNFVESIAEFGFGVRHQTFPRAIVHAWNPVDKNRDAR